MKPTCSHAPTFTCRTPSHANFAKKSDKNSFKSMRNRWLIDPLRRGLGVFSQVCWEKHIHVYSLCDGLQSRQPILLLLFFFLVLMECGAEQLTYLSPHTLTSKIAFCHSEGKDSFGFNGARPHNIQHQYHSRNSTFDGFSRGRLRDQLGENHPGWSGVTRARMGSTIGVCCFRHSSEGETAAFSTTSS